MVGTSHRRRTRIHLTRWTSRCPAKHSHGSCTDGARPRSHGCRRPQPMGRRPTAPGRCTWIPRRRSCSGRAIGAWTVRSAGGAGRSPADGWSRVAVHVNRPAAVRRCGLAAVGSTTPDDDIGHRHRQSTLDIDAGDRRLITTLETDVGGTPPDDDLGAGRRRTTMARWRTTGPSSAERVGFEPTDHFKGGPRISSAVRSTRLRHLSRRERRLSLSPSAAHRPSIRLGRCGIEPAPVGHDPVGATAGTSAGAGAGAGAVDDAVRGEGGI